MLLAERLLPVSVLLGYKLLHLVLLSLMFRCLRQMASLFLQVKLFHPVAAAAVILQLQALLLLELLGLGRILIVGTVVQPAGLRSILARLFVFQTSFSTTVQDVAQSEPSMRSSPSSILHGSWSIPLF